MILASFTITLQSQTLARARVMARLINGHQTTLDERSARAMILPLVGESLLAPVDADHPRPLPLNGTVTPIEIDGRVWQVSVQGVAGVPDLFTTPLPVFDALFPGVAGLSSANVAAFRERVERDKVFVTEQALIELGLNPSDRDKVRDHVVVGAGSAKLNVPAVSLELSDIVTDLPRVFLQSIPVEEVVLEVAQ